MRDVVRNRWLITAYAAAIFLSAFLLFQIQPLVTKFILPWFGGSPAVWTTCLLFFQTALFAGYAYAFFIDQRLRPRQQAIVHVVLLITALATLGVLPDESWQPDPKSAPLDRILVTLAASVGLPYFVLSATGPLLQAWFARSFPDRAAYRLYALSNVGSLLALISYPFVFERHFELPRQATIWSVGFIFFAILCAFAAWTQARGRVSPKLEIANSSFPKDKFEFRRNSATCLPTWTQRFLWLLWPACGSIVLMATTNHVSTDIAVTPLFWIVPLALYLLTFIITFDRPAWYRPTIIAALTLAAIYAAAFVHKNGVGSVNRKDCGTPGRLYTLIQEGEAPAEPPQLRITSLQFLAANFAAMFFICFVCHGELVRNRPPTRYLTSFYLMIAAGGALGGAFVTLFAPRLFTTYLEWELSLVASAIFAIGLLLRALVNAIFRDDGTAAISWRPVLLAALALGPAAIVLLDLAEFLPHSNKGIHLRVRNFFGTLAVRERAPDDPLAHNFVLQHGAITHGSQFTHESRRRQPITYFSPASGIGHAIQYYRDAQSGPLHIGVLGLGVGTLAAYAEPGDRFAFYEINPEVIDIAKNDEWFTYLHDAKARGAEYIINVGDGRLSLRQELQPASQRPATDSNHRAAEVAGANEFDLLALDAFSGDSVPIHLLTLEAFEVYLRHIARDSGAIAVNISNRYVDLEPVLRGTAEHFDLRWLRIHNHSDRANGIYSADWIILTRNNSLIAALIPYSRPAKPARSILWTDANSSILDVLK